MHTEQRDRARTFFAERGIRQAVLSSTATVKWLTGFAPPPQVGPHPFAGGPPLIVYDSDRFKLLIVDGLADLASTIAKQSDCDVRTYSGYTIHAPIDGQGGLRGALATALSPRPTAVETHDLPAYLLDLISEVTSIDGWTAPLRVVKTQEELKKLEANFRLSDIGQAAARKAVVAGANEMDVYLAAYDAIHRSAGERVPIGNDYVVGSRKNNIGGWPGAATIRDGDSFIVDISTLRYGYWSDSCATYYAGSLSTRQKAMHDTATRALQVGASMLRPGVVAKDVDRAVREVIESAGFPVYPHHTGHGVGVTGHEAPRIVPYSEEVLQPGMVVMLEPGIYFPGETSVRLEDAFLVQEGEVKQLTSHDKGYHPG